MSLSARKKKKNIELKSQKQINKVMEADPAAVELSCESLWTSYEHKNGRTSSVMGPGVP